MVEISRVKKDLWNETRDKQCSDFKHDLLSCPHF